MGESNFMSECPFKKPTKDIYSKECQDPNKLSIISHDITGLCELKKASPRRDWMENTAFKYANGCLPLASANELGWSILCPFDFLAVWDGGDDEESIKIGCENPREKDFVMSHFGYGILTFNVGRLFETTIGHGLYVKGPTNCYKKYIRPLEGLVETDWLTFRFTMNWKIEEPNKEILFQEGEPICQIFPYPRDYLNKFQTYRRFLSGNMGEKFREFNASRGEHNEDLKNKDINSIGDILQNNYLSGRYHDGTKCDELGFKHEPRCKAKEFPERE